MAKLNKTQVAQIRNFFKTGQYMQKELAKMFGVGNMQISRIIRYKRWNGLRKLRQAQPTVQFLRQPA